MSNIILQPSSNKDAREHYVDTIANPVKLEFIRDYIDFKDFNKLKEIYPSGNCKIWGVTPSKINFNKWKRIKTGDITLFSKKGKIYSSATTTYKLQRPMFDRRPAEYMVEAIFNSGSLFEQLRSKENQLVRFEYLEAIAPRQWCLYSDVQARWQWCDHHPWNDCWLMEDQF